MAISIYWEDAEESIIVVEIVGSFTWDEAFHATKQAVEMVAGKTHRCDAIYNLLSGKANSYGAALQNGRKIINAYPKNLVMLVLTTQSLGRILLNPLRRLDPSLVSRAHVAPDMAQARGMIMRSRHAQIE